MKLRLTLGETKMFMESDPAVRPEYFGIGQKILLFMPRGFKYQMHACLVCSTGSER